MIELNHFYSFDQGNVILLRRSRIFFMTDKRATAI